MTPNQTLTQWTLHNKSGDVITDVQLEQWATERAHLLGLLAVARNYGRQIALLLGEGEVGRQEAARIARDLMTLGTEEHPAPLRQGRTAGW